MGRSRGGGRSRPASRPARPPRSGIAGWLALAALVLLLLAVGAARVLPRPSADRGTGAPAPPTPIAATLPAAPTETVATVLPAGPALAPFAPGPNPQAPTTTPTATPPPSPTPLPPTATPLPAKRILDVPMHRQEHPLSCEAAALKMAMGVLGVAVSEESLLDTMARDATPRQAMPDGRVVWGDPDLGYVGRWDGVFARDGYGVYEKPIADLALAHGFKGTQYGRGYDPKELYAAVRQGFPVVVWAPYELTVKGRGSWYTPAGKRVDYVVTMHAMVLAGVDAEGVYYADPLKPTLQKAPYAAFEAAFTEIDRRAVILRP